MGRFEGNINHLSSWMISSCIVEIRVNWTDRWRQ